MFSHSEQLLVLLLQLGLQLPQPLLHVTVAFFCLEAEDRDYNLISAQSQDFILKVTTAAMIHHPSWRRTLFRKII